ncbi:hypothetical protein FNQ90_06695 [Streptomyces alkaliphilus]|uniref:Uncharacterized protein n=1 Tax=Streptomyces alkaliphilus TaxID=1472722 RepID=A0A7W3TBG3_9ACTN|nr:hypothetical protein [Streptomyces alkaliphilus]MBB0243801.1 hypothetical protein [Streptomyces alkaliphilus]
MKQLSGAIHDLASEVVSVLRDGDHRSVAGAGAVRGDEAVLRVAAVRALGADVLLPTTLLRRPPEEPVLALVREAMRTYPPGPDASSATVWSHWAMERTVLRLTSTDGVPDRGGRRPTGAPPTAQPDVSDLESAPWQRLTHQLAVLGALAVPEADSAVAEVARRRSLDVSRGFVRAVRRRDWFQAAGAGRWLAAVRGAPGTLGLDTGLDFVLHMGGADPRVALHTHAARWMRATDPGGGEGAPS